MTEMVDLKDAANVDPVLSFAVCVVHPFGAGPVEARTTSSAFQSS